MAKNDLKVFSEKQKRFVEEYIIDLNPTAAALRAGYPKSSATSWAKKLMLNKHIAEHIEKALNDRAERTKITQDRVITELAAIAFATLSDICEWDSNGIKLINSNLLPREKIAAVAEVIESSTGKGTKIKLHAKLKALEMLGKHLGMFASSNSYEDQDENSLPELPTEIVEELEHMLS